MQKSYETKEYYRKRIKELYDKPGYPRISAIMSVSCTTQEGIRELQERIHTAAIKAVDPDTKEHVIGQMVCPLVRTYVYMCMYLQVWYSSVAYRRECAGIPPPPYFVVT